MTLEALADIEALMGREGRDRLLHLGIDHGERARAAIAAAVRAGDAGTAKQEAHGLRGAIAPFGAPALADLLQRFEAGETDLAGAVDAAVADFVGACRAALG